MVRALMSIALSVVAVSLVGCGTGGGEEVETSTSTMKPTQPTSPTTTTSDLDPRTPLYVVVRLDNVAIKQEVEHRDAAEVINWFLQRKEKLNLGMITGGSVHEWPTDCSSSLSATTEKKKYDACTDDETVKMVNKAYRDKTIVGSAGERLLEMCVTGHDAYSWHEHWDVFSPKENFADWLEGDLTKSISVLNQAYPDAIIQTLAVPQNLADEGTLATAKAHNLDIVSAESTMNCENPNWAPGPPLYDYSVAPCQVTKAGVLTPQCLPADDVWVTEEGFQRVGGVLSVPMGSSNAHIPQSKEGLTVDDTIGLDKCECSASSGNQLTCSIVSSAKNNARKSGNLHWTGLLLNPQTNFQSSCGHNNYTRWLDDFYDEVSGLTEFNVKFVHYQDIPNLRPPLAELRMA